MPNIETPNEFVTRIGVMVIENKPMRELIAITSTRDASIRAESAALLKTCGEALEETTRQLEAMNTSSAHAASWVEPRSHSTTEQIVKNKAALAALREAGVSHE